MASKKVHQSHVSRDCAASFPGLRRGRLISVYQIVRLTPQVLRAEGGAQSHPFWDGSRFVAPSPAFGGRAFYKAILILTFYQSTIIA
jgi:hypothetical protein